MVIPGGFPQPEAVLEQEARLQLPSCSVEDALWIGEWLLARAVEGSLAVTVEVWHGDRLVFRAARPGTDAHNDLYLAGKLRVVRHFRHSSLYERVRHLAADTTFEEATSLRFPEYAPHGGGVPLAVRGTGMVGVALVSGLPQLDDHALVVEALEAFLAAHPG
ncbi:MAG TPA: heme-binding protein [Candidatus Limnocylindrales bacterium]|nr:heme-binding protein [Candidatus Limnocylindrales bacterium]